MGKIFLRGLLAIAPIAITIILVIWLYNHLENIFGAPILYYYPQMYFPGIGIIIAIIVLFVLGLMLNHWIIQSIYAKVERLFKRIPFLKTIYTSVTDLMTFFNTDKDKSKKVVMVKVMGLKILGIVTRETFDDLPNGIGTDEEVAVFLPFSYQIGGITIVVPKSNIEQVDFTVEKGIRFMATAASPSGEKQ